MDVHCPVSICEVTCSLLIAKLFCKACAGHFSFHVNGILITLLWVKHYDIYNNKNVKYVLKFFVELVLKFDLCLSALSK